ncbi:GntR family transcriptional regulator [Streptomyces sp. NPDC102340]|uniref:GntR family transcriptional regulator n=1 Tax=unclassified Streptomyces TaxID=2593676 RepID=UPI003815AFDE
MTSTPPPPSPGRAALEATDDRLPLHVRLRELLLDRIRTGEWTPATPLPGEIALADHYGVSKGTLRRVLGELVDQGLLERRRGDGTYVRRARLDQSLHRFFRHGSADDTLPDSRILQWETGAASAEVAEHLELGADGEVLTLRRLRTRSGSPVLVEDIWLPLPRFTPLIEAGAEALGSLLYPAYEKLAGQVVGGASEDLTVRPCDQADAALLGCGAGEPVVVVERLARAHDGSPLELRVSRGRADTFRYRIELT